LTNALTIVAARLARGRAPAGQVQLVDVVGRPRLEHVEVLGQRQEVLRGAGVACGLGDGLAQARVGDRRGALLEVEDHAGAGQKVRQLLLLRGALRGGERLGRHPHVAQLQRDPQRVEVAPHLGIAQPGRAQGRAVVGLGQVGRARGQVEARAARAARVDERRQQVEPLDLEEEVDRLRLRVVLEVVGRNLVDEREEVVGRGGEGRGRSGGSGGSVLLRGGLGVLGRGGVLAPRGPLVPDLARQGADVLVAPGADGALFMVEELS